MISHLTQTDLLTTREEIALLKSRVSQEAEEIQALNSEFNRLQTAYQEQNNTLDSICESRVWKIRKICRDIDNWSK